MAVPNTERGGRRGSDSGFTLVEMMVALVVISILVAIAIPTFLSARERSNDRSAQAKANTGLKAHKARSADNHGYASLADALDRLEEMEPSVEFLDGSTLPSTDDAFVKGAVYVRVEDDVTTPSPDADVVTLVASSKTGRCFWTRDVNGNTTYAVTNCGEEPVDFTNKWVK